jgi:hypothetical protein
MDVIHFTHGATDPLESVGIRGAHFVPLADGEGDAHVRCVHLDLDATIESPSLTHAAALLVVHGRIKVSAHVIGAIAHLRGGMGFRGISTPERITGQTWPSDALVPR